VDRLASFLWSREGIKFLADLGSVVFGMLGTWLMSRRYARDFWQNLLSAFLLPLMFLLGRGARFRDVVKKTINANSDIQDSVPDMAMGLYSLFWAFFLQLIALGVETFK
jgi:hypothetical protein